MGFKGGAGALNRRITILKKTDAASAMGGQKEVWVPDTTIGRSGTVAAAYEPKVGFEWPKLGNREVAAEKRQEQANARFRIRYGPTLSVEGNRVRYEGRDWNIISVTAMPNGRPIEVHIEVTDIR